MRKFVLTFIYFAMAAAAALAQVTFKIEAPRQAEVGQQIRVRYVANTTDVEDIQVNDFNGFKVAYGPSTSRSSNFSMINGKTKRVPLGDVAGKLKAVDPECQMIREAKGIGISFGD